MSDAVFQSQTTTASGVSAPLGLAAEKDKHSASVATNSDAAAAVNAECIGDYDEEDFDLEGSVYDKLRNQRTAKQKSLNDARVAAEELSRRVAAGDAALRTVD